MATGALLVVTALTARAGEEPPSDLQKRVDAAIARGVVWLKSACRPEGILASPTSGVQGQALAYLALRSSGVSKDDPTAVAAYETLRLRYEAESQAGTLDTRAAGMACRAVALHGELRGAVDETGEPRCVVGDAERAWLMELVGSLERSQSTDGAWPSCGGTGRTDADYRDFGFTYAAVLGLKAAARAGIRVNPETWSKALRYYVESQDPTGTRNPKRKERNAGARKTTAGKPRGWSGRAKTGPPEESTEWDTANAVASLALCRSELLASRRGNDDARAETSIRDGLAFLCRFRVVFDWPKLKDHLDSELTLPLLCAYERVGDATGTRALDGFDWYVEGAVGLVGRQESDGGWRDRWLHANEKNADRAWADDIACTSYALSFLSRRTRAVRWSLTAPFDDTDIDFELAPRLAKDDFEDFIELVLSRWRRASDPHVKERLFTKATAVGPKIVDPLVRRLGSSVDVQRTGAFALLKRATGLDHGYDPTADVATRDAAALEWARWYAMNDTKLRFDLVEQRIVVR
jgi:hypothetical protein